MNFKNNDIIDARSLVVAAALAATLGFSGTSAGDLHPEGLGPVVKLGVTQADRALAGMQVRRFEVINGYAKRYRIAWDLAQGIHDASIAERIAPDLGFRLVRVESSFRGDAVGPAGAIGYAQVQFPTARWLDSTVTREDLFDQDTNLRFGFRYLRMLTNRYGDERIALLAYNRGPGTVERLLAEGADPANGYATRVLGRPITN